MRHLLLPVLALSMAILAPQTVLPADDKSKADHDHNMMAAESCAKACNDCQRACDMCATHCANLLAQGKKDHVQTLQTCQDCATVCTAAAGITARTGPFMDSICKSCAEACSRCSKACDKYSDDPHMKKCADECKACEKACKDMLQYLALNTEK
jgi:hypothetical protein